MKKEISSYAKKVLDFIDHPWQEDAEIVLVELFNEYRSEIESNFDSSTKSYLRSMEEANGILGRQGFTEAFVGAFSELLKN